MPESCFRGENLKGAERQCAPVCSIRLSLRDVLYNAGALIPVFFFAIMGNIPAIRCYQLHSHLYRPLQERGADEKSRHCISRKNAGGEGKDHQKILQELYRQFS